LKILEEPPEKTLFILLCESTERVLPTILSRTQLIKIPSVDEASMASYLNSIEQENQASIEQASNAVRLAHGNVVTGLQSLFSNDEQQFFLQSYITLMRLAWKPQVIELLDWADQTAGWGREQLKAFFLFVLRITRENLMMCLRQEYLLRVTSEEFDFVKKFSSSVSFTALTQVAREFDLAYVHVNANGNAKIILADLVLQVAKTLKMKE
jgi:DNA polymerase-3 subunit delta'